MTDTKPCLHCELSETLRNHYGGGPDAHIHFNDAIGNVVQVLADLIGSIPERNIRRQFMKEADEMLRCGVAERINRHDDESEVLIHNVH